MSGKIFLRVLLATLLFGSIQTIPVLAEDTAPETVEIPGSGAAGTAEIVPEGSEGPSSFPEESEDPEPTAEESGDNTEEIPLEESDSEESGISGEQGTEDVETENVAEETPELEFTSFASVEITETDVSESIEGDIAVPDGCEVTDTGGNVHSFPEDDSPSSYLAVCVLVAAQEAGHISGFELTDSGFGLYVESIHGISPGDTEYWALWLNDGFADCGIGCLPVSAGDAISLVLTDWEAGTESDTIELRITALEGAAESEPLSITGNIALPNGCEVVDADGDTHIFPENVSKEYLAICAFAEALAEGLVEDIEFADFGFGLFIESVNGITAENAYWKLERNGTGASVGAAELELAAGDTLSLALTQFDPATFEETPLDDRIVLTIESLDATFNNIILPNSCSVTDANGSAHEFPEDGSAPAYLAVCTLAEALAEGYANDIDFSDFGFGLFVDNFNNIVKPENSYWQFRMNGVSASVGVTEAVVEEGDIVSFVLTAFDPVSFEESPVEPGQSFELRIIALETLPGDGESEEDPEDETGTGGDNSSEEETVFNVPGAVTFLKNAQGGNGGFANSRLYSDWAAIAYGAADVGGSARSSLLSYMRSSSGVSSLVTDNERRAMAILALGENPYDFGGVNYIEAILAEFDGTQFGDDDLVNDDIFALIPLASAGYDEDDEVITKTIEFVLSEQRGDGSWEGSVDVTAAAIQALRPFRSESGVRSALDQAETYLLNEQENDGGWGNISSTSWALQAGSALGASWSKNGKDGLDYLAAMQSAANNGGAVLPATESAENVIWGTSYAIPAGLGLPWSDILESVSRPEEDASSNDEDEEEQEDTEDTATDDNTPVNDDTSAETPLAVFLPSAPVFAPSENVPALLSSTAGTGFGNGAEQKNEESQTIAETEEMNPIAFTAAAANALPEDDFSSHLPLIIGGASGIVLLYAAAKLFLL